MIFRGEGESTVTCEGIQDDGQTMKGGLSKFKQVVSNPGGSARDGFLTKKSLKLQ